MSTSREEYKVLFREYLQEKIGYLGIFSKDTLTIEICKGLSEEPELLEYIPEEISEHNEISEEGRYFIINGNKVKKVAFLQELLPKKDYNKLCYTNTSGKLLLTIDPEWFEICSDRSYCSWTSCFSPNGENWFCPYEYSLSKHCLLALIVNDDESKIIARRFIFIPEDEDGNMGNIILFNRHYGTFPVSYQRELSNFIISRIFGENKDNWGYEFTEEDNGNEIVTEFERNTSVEGIGNHYGSWNRDFSYYEDRDCYRSKIWIDFANYLFYRKPIEQGRYLISFHNSLEMEHCSACDCNVPVENLVNVICWDDENKQVYTAKYCSRCASELAERDIFNEKLYNKEVPHLDVLYFYKSYLFEGNYIKVKQGRQFMKNKDDLVFEEGVIDYMAAYSKYDSLLLICYNFNLVKDYLLVAASNPDGIVRKEGSLLKMPLVELRYIEDAVYKLNRKDVMSILRELDEEEEPSIAIQ